MKSHDFKMAASMGKNHRLTLAYQNLESIPEKILKRHGTKITELDLTSNKIVEFRFLQDIPFLTTLILDRNEIVSHVKFPILPNLHTLWLNHNNIANLGTMIQTLVSCFPNLRYLSMMNNPAAPSYFNGGSLIQYQDYRHFVISRFPLLEVLDDQHISQLERQEALRIYGSRETLDGKRRKSRRSSSLKPAT